MAWAPFNDGNQVASGLGPRAGVRFADISGSGKVDYLFVDKAGGVRCAVNGGQGPDGWQWTPLPDKIAGGVPGANQDNVFFADVNGDGRADYAVVGKKGEVDFWLNIGSYKSYHLNWTHLPNYVSKVRSFVSAQSSETWMRCICIKDLSHCSYLPMLSGMANSTLDSGWWIWNAKHLAGGYHRRWKRRLRNLGPARRIEWFSQRTR